MGFKTLAKIQSARPQLYGKVALITGGNRGIGLAVARTLADAGCKIIIAGRNQSALNRTERELAPRTRSVMSVICDVRDPGAVESLLAEIKRKFHRLDILINNAGIAHANLSVAKLPVDAWTEVIETNLTGMFLVTQAALPLMKRGGAIVNNLSIAAKRVFPGSSAYIASKHGALGFTNALREELRAQGIRVIALLPGATDTAIWSTLWPDAPRKKMMSAKAVASAVVNALTVPIDSTVEELTILPSAGTL
jgi:NAD(P)-dependent dehydrogenase (short-subunit alcohol dehydrogenase family)